MAVFAHADRERVARADEAFRALNPKSPRFANEVEQFLLGLDGRQREQLTRKLELLRWLGERDLLPCPKAPLQAGSVGDPTVIVGGVPSGARSISYCRPAHEVLQVAYRFTEDPEMWEDVPWVCEYFLHRLPNDPGVMSYCRMLIESIDHARREGREAALKELKENTEWERGTLTPDDWRRALLDTTELRKAVVHLYAEKGRARRW
jgi:hypothetical protein